jgi:hypothetical protein
MSRFHTPAHRPLSDSDGPAKNITRRYGLTYMLAYDPA